MKDFKLCIKMYKGLRQFVIIEKETLKNIKLNESYFVCQIVQLNAVECI